jgi:hypothetical protein
MTTELSTNTTPARGLALASFDDAFRFATMVAKSDFAPKDFKGKPESCLLAIQHGSEIGLSPMQSLQNIACINGRPAIWGDAALAVAMASPVCEYVTEKIDGDGESMVATCEAKRRGYEKPTVARFSVADAKKAGLWGKSGPWSQYSRRMLQLRARGFALRDAFPDVLKGLVTAEEAQDYPTTPEPVTVRPKFNTATTHVAEIQTTQQGDDRIRELARQLPQATTATDADMQKARHYVQTATAGQLERMQKIVEARLKAGIYTPAQADELLNLINGKLDILSSVPEDRGQEFVHEAAQHEVAT